MSYTLYSIFFCFLIFQLNHAQENIRYYSIKGHYGFILAHSEELKPISKTNPYGLQVEYSWLKTSDKAWKTCNCYGRSGFSFAFYNYNNPSVLGNSYNALYFVEPYLSYQNKLKISLRGTIGATYLDKIFDENDNPENLLFSSSLSFFLGLSLNFNYHLNTNYVLNFSANYNHISNGGQKQPNKGMNFPTFSIGLDKMINYQALKQKPDSLKLYDPGFKYYVGSFFSLRSSDREAEATNHPLIGFTGGALKPLSRINGFNAGVELWYDWSDRAISKRENFNNSAFSSAINLGHHFNFGNFYFLQQFGIYTTRPQDIQGNWMYQRYSFWYSMGKRKRWTIGASLIAYGKVADHMDGRLIYILN